MQRYEEYTGIMNDDSGKRRYETLYYPTFTPKTTDYYIVAKVTDRLDNLAADYYGDPRMWIVIARANKLYNGSFKIPPGTRLRIPFPVENGLLSNLFREANQ